MNYIIKDFEFHSFGLGQQLYASGNTCTCNHDPNIILMVHTSKNYWSPKLSDEQLLDSIALVYPDLDEIHRWAFDGVNLCRSHGEWIVASQGTFSENLLGSLDQNLKRLYSEREFLKTVLSKGLEKDSFPSSRTHKLLEFIVRQSGYF